MIRTTRKLQRWFFDYIESIGKSIYYGKSLVKQNNVIGHKRLITTIDGRSIHETDLHELSISWSVSMRNM